MASAVSGTSGSDRKPNVTAALWLTYQLPSEPPMTPFPYGGKMHPRRHLPSQLKAILPQSADPNNNACGSQGAARSCRKGGGSLVTGRENSRDQQQTERCFAVPGYLSLFPGTDQTHYPWILSKPTQTCCLAEKLCLASVHVHVGENPTPASLVWPSPKGTTRRRGTDPALAKPVGPWGARTPPSPLPHRQNLADFRCGKGVLRCSTARAW